MNGVAFSIGPVSVYWYSIFIMIGALIAFFLITVESKRFDIPDNFVENLSFIMKSPLYCLYFKVYSNSTVKSFFHFFIPLLEIW